MKKTCCDQYVHVVCALFTEGVEFTDKDVMEPVNVSKVLNFKRTKMCVFCDLNNAYCIKCATKKCNNYLHVTCGQQAGSLEEVLTKNDTIHFFGYCKEHKKQKRLSSDNIKNMIAVKRKENMARKVLNSDAAWILGEGSTQDSVPSTSAPNSQVSDLNNGNYFRMLLFVLIIRSLFLFVCIYEQQQSMPHCLVFWEKQAHKILLHQAFLHKAERMMI